MALHARGYLSNYLQHLSSWHLNTGNGIVLSDLWSRLYILALARHALVTSVSK